MNKIDSLEYLKYFSDSESPTIKFSQVCSLIKIMENELDCIKPDHRDDELWNAYFGYQAALNSVKKFFLGDWKVNTETGDIVTTLMGEQSIAYNLNKNKGGE